MKFRESLEPLQLERIESPYRTNNDSNEERCRTLLIQHLDKHGCITRTDFMRLAEISRNKAIEHSQDSGDDPSHPYIS